MPLIDVTTYYAVCDGEDCGYEEELVADSETYAAREAERGGWQIDAHGKYLCPNCAKKEAENE